MRNILTKIINLFKNINIKDILWNIKITFFRTRKSLRKTFKKAKYKYPKIFNPTQNRAFLIVAFIMVLCIILSTTYAIFVYLTSSYRAADIRFANLTYSIKIDNANTTTKTISAGATTTIELELNALNTIASKYLIYYTTTDTDIDVQYSSITTGKGKGTIGAEGFRVIRIVITNNSASSVTTTFNVKGGYVYNNLSLSSGEYEISGIYDESSSFSGDITLFTYVNGKRVPEVPSYSEMQSNDYIFDEIASSCTNDATISYSGNSNGSEINISNISKPSICNAVFHNKDDLTVSFIKDGQYLSEAPPKSDDIEYTITSACNNDASIDWDETNWTADVADVVSVPTNCVVNFLQQPTLADMIKTNNPPTTYATVPGQVASTTDEGLIEGPNDDYGDTTYYFRGTASDNYVSFAGKTWRIVRINGDGSVRLILDDLARDSSNNLIDVSWSNVTIANNITEALSYLDYGNSIVKENVETWYDNNIGNNVNYANKVVPTKFCNDKTYTITSSSSYNFGSYNRIVPSSSANPSFTCPTNISEGNDIYNLNIGLLTIDEMEFAGMYWDGDSMSSYLSDSSAYYWSMSPFIWNGGNYLTVFIIDMLEIYPYTLNNSAGFYPVISLSSNITATINPTNPGTIDNPYVVE